MQEDSVCKGVLAVCEVMQPVYDMQHYISHAKGHASSTHPIHNATAVWWQLLQL
jgi:hypothetical protein